MKRPSLKTTRIEPDDWWAYQLRVVRRQGTQDIKQYDTQLVSFIRKALHLEPGQRVLNLGCGSGEHSQLLHEEGVLVHGIDISKRLIHYCKRQARRTKGLTFWAEDMRRMNYEAEFDAVVCLGVTFGAYSDSQNQEILRRIGGALVSGGKVLLQLPDLAITAERLKQGHYWQERPEGNYLAKAWYDPILNMGHGRVIFIDRDGTTHLQEKDEVTRLYTAREIRAMFTRVGLEHLAAYGNILLPLTSYGPECHREMLVVGEKPTDKDWPDPPLDGNWPGE